MKLLKTFWMSLRYYWGAFMRRLKGFASPPNVDTTDETQTAMNDPHVEALYYDIGTGSDSITYGDPEDVSFENDTGTFELADCKLTVTPADHYADEIIEIADKTTDPQKARVQIDSRKWIASKLKPKKYGDRQTVEHDTTDNFNDFLTKLKNG